MKSKAPKWRYTCPKCGKNVPVIRYDRETAELLCDKCFEEVNKSR